jgi:hypothetical protein
MMRSALKDLKHGVWQRWPRRFLVSAASVAAILDLEVLLFWNCTAENGAAWEALQFFLRCCGDLLPVDLRSISAYPTELQCNLERARLIFIVNAICGLTAVLLVILAVLVLGFDRPRRIPTEGEAMTNVVRWFSLTGAFIFVSAGIYLFYMSHLRGRIPPRVTEYRWTALIDLVLAVLFFLTATFALICIYMVARKPELHRPEDVI